MIPISAVITTKNEETRIRRCIDSLPGFSEIIVVDSHSTDRTCESAAQAGAQTILFRWNGAYPKKRQWCLDNLALKNDWVFFIDADEIATPALTRAIAALFADGRKPDCDGYFIRGRYVINGRPLRFGLHNAKLCLLNRTRLSFPQIDDLDCPGMGEIEGHYQPRAKPGATAKIGLIKPPLLHHAHNEGWEERHRRYAAWEAAMNAKNAWPRDPSPRRETLKRLFRAMPCRPAAAFLHCYIARLGCLDGAPGLRLALSRARYYAMIAAAASKARDKDAAA